jgi:pyruvate/2-oxoglutarate dehydrogenase complex dihydrolipoamide acyltransferase (E2) component
MHYSPAAAFLIQRYGVDVGGLVASGPKARVTKGDVLQRLRTMRSESVERVVLDYRDVELHGVFGGYPKVGLHV